MENPSRCNVLLVDDDLAQIEAARCAVAGFSPEIVLSAVPGGDALLDWLLPGAPKSAPMPNIILLDLKLPKLDNLAVLRKLRAHGATREVPIVVYSAAYNQADVLMSYKAGANSFVPKPTDPDTFSELFRERLVYWIQSKRDPFFVPGNQGAEKRV